MQIQKTSAYHQFRTIKGNRKVSEQHVRSLVNSISQKNLLESNPILVDENMNIIDGQHRLEAARKLNIPVYYIIVEQTGLPEIQLINSAQKEWSLLDYLSSYIAVGNEEYIRLQAFIAKWDLPISAGVRLLSTENKNLTSFRKGEFNITNEILALEVVEMVKAFKPYITRRIRRSREFLSAVFNIVERKIVTQKQMEERLGFYDKRLYQVDSAKEYLRQIEDAYNHNKKMPIRFY